MLVRMCDGNRTASSADAIVQQWNVSPHVTHFSIWQTTGTATRRSRREKIYHEKSLSLISTRILSAKSSAEILSNPVYVLLRSSTIDSFGWWWYATVTKSGHSRTYTTNRKWDRNRLISAEGICVPIQLLTVFGFRITNCFFDQTNEHDSKKRERNFPRCHPAAHWRDFFFLGKLTNYIIYGNFISDTFFQNWSPLTRSRCSIRQRHWLWATSEALEVSRHQQKIHFFLHPQRLLHSHFRSYGGTCASWAELHVQHTSAGVKIFRKWGNQTEFSHSNQINTLSQYTKTINFESIILSILLDAITWECLC